MQQQKRFYPFERHFIYYTIIWCTFSGSRVSRLLERSNPSLEKTLSAVIEVAGTGMARYFLASFASRGYFPTFPFQKSTKGSRFFLRLTSLLYSYISLLASSFLTDLGMESSSSLLELSKFDPSRLHSSGVKRRITTVIRLLEDSWKLGNQSPF